MKEFKKEMKTYHVWAYCDCGGELVPTGQCYTSNPPQYPHICNNCEHQEVLLNFYPYIRHEVVDE